MIIDLKNCRHIEVVQDGVLVLVVRNTPTEQFILITTPEERENKEDILKFQERLLKDKNAALETKKGLKITVIKD